MADKTYDPSLMSIMIGGTLASDKAWNTVAAERDEDKWTFTTGTSGELTRTKNLNKAGVLEIVTPQTSDLNDTLSGFELSGALISCSIIDKSGRTVALMPQGTVTKIPRAEFGKEAGEREWALKGNIPDPFLLGGN